MIPPCYNRQHQNLSAASHCYFIKVYIKHLEQNSFTLVAKIQFLRYYINITQFWLFLVALQLNRLMEHSQHHATSSAVFQLPPGTVPSILSSHLPSNLVSSGATTPLTSVLKPPVFTLPGASSGSQSMVTSTPSFMQSSIAAGVDRSNSLGMQFVVSSVAPVQSMNQPNLGEV